MSNVFVISDLHLDHKRILDFSPERGGSTLEEHNEWIVERWNSRVTKRDTVWVLGDVCFSQSSLHKYIPRLHGSKQLVRGNHDKMSTAAYLQYFNNVYGLVNTRGYWLSHAPIHPQELRGRKNIAGHLHNKHVLLPDGSIDKRYIIVSVEHLNGIPISFDELKERE